MEDWQVCLLVAEVTKEPPLMSADWSSLGGLPPSAHPLYLESLASCAAVTIAASHGTLTGQRNHPVNLGPCRSPGDPQVKGGGVDCGSAML